MRKKIGIGISDFRKLRQGSYLFIDKSLLIQEIIQGGADIILLPRPRRFGKTLNLSMLRYFFEMPAYHEDADLEKLFHGLAISETDLYRQHAHKYPVIYLTFKDVKERDFHSALYNLHHILHKEIKRHYVRLVDSDRNSLDSSNDIARIINGTAEPELYKLSIASLSEFLHKIYGVPPVILIDEYDTPIHAAWQHGYYEEMISFMRGLLSGAFKDNPHIFKGIITGILRVAKESIFSDLNNLDVYTILDRAFSDKFGITPHELKELFNEYGLERRLDEADSWYNGYRFGESTIFNPWSVLNFVNQNPPRPKPYWANTSSNELVRELITEGSLDIRDNIKRLISGESIDSVIDENIVFPDLKKREHYVYSLLFFSGYLKCEEEIPEPRKLRCRLAIPNEEVRYIYESIISDWVTEPFGNEKLNTMLHALINGNIDQFQRLLNEFVITTLSFFDTKGKNPEAVFQAFILGMLLNLGQEYEISSNRELGYGRFDVLVVPKEDRSRLAVLMELKSIAGFYEEEPEKAIAEAVKQIENREYAKELRARDYTNILKIVIVSDGKKVWVKTL